MSQTSGWVSISRGTSLNSRCVGPLPSLCKALLNQLELIANQDNQFTGVTLATEIVAEPCAIGGLREHACERVFSDSSRARDEHRVRHALVGQHAAKRGHNARVAHKFRK